MGAGLRSGTLSISHGMSASVVVFAENIKLVPSGEGAGS